MPSNPGLAVAFVVLLSFLYLFTGMRARRQARRRAAAENRPPLLRPLGRAGSAMFIRQMMLAACLLLLYEQRAWTPSSVGLATSVSPALAFATGVASYSVFWLVVNLVARISGVLDTVEDANFRALAQIWPRTSRQRAFAMLAITALNPVTEELLFRGILVHQVAVAAGGASIPLALGLLVNLSNHLYQGRWGLVSHVPMYVFVAAFLFSPLGLVAAIGFHYAGDVVPLLMLRRHLASYRERRRRLRRTARAAA